MKCVHRIAPIGHDEIECLVSGEHTVHRYRDKFGKVHRVEFVDYPWPGNIATRKRHSDKMEDG